MKLLRSWRRRWYTWIMHDITEMIWLSAFISFYQLLSAIYGISHVFLHWLSKLFPRNHFRSGFGMFHRCSILVPSLMTACPDFRSKIWTWSRSTAPKELRRCVSRILREQHRTSNQKITGFHRFSLSFWGLCMTICQKERRTMHALVK